MDRTVSGVVDIRVVGAGVGRAVCGTVDDVVAGKVVVAVAAAVVAAMSGFVRCKRKVTGAEMVFPWLG